MSGCRHADGYATTMASTRCGSVCDRLGMELLVELTGTSNATAGVSKQAMGGQTILSSIEPWADVPSGVSLGYPAGWVPMPLPDLSSDAQWIEPGFTIGFESPRTSEDDIFADYLLVEILPGRQSGQFITDGSQRMSADIAGRLAWRDRLNLNEHPVDGGTVDLSIRQAGFSGLGYTVGLYVIGEQSESAYLDDVFEVLLQTFNIEGEPFQVI